MCGDAVITINALKTGLNSVMSQRWDTRQDSHITSEDIWWIRNETEEGTLYRKLLDALESAWEQIAVLQTVPPEQREDLHVFIHELADEAQKAKERLKQAEAERDVLAKHMFDMEVLCPEQPKNFTLYCGGHGCPNDPMPCWLAWARIEARKREEEAACPK